MDDSVFVQTLDRELTTLELVEMPKVLYKYRTWNNLEYPFHKDIITKNQIYLARPSSFEDPNDCINPLRYDLLTDDELEFWLQLKFRELHPKYNETAIRRLAKEQMKSPHFRDPKWQAEFEQHYQELYDLKAGIFSVTDNPASLEMWQKYGDEFSGICYGFDSIRLVRETGIGSGGKVSYVKTLPIISPFDSDEIKFFKRIFCKEELWTFEEEFRLNKFEVTNRLPTYKSGTLKEAIIGPKFPEESKEELLEILSLRHPNAIILKARKHADKIVLEVLDKFA